MPVPMDLNVRDGWSVTPPLATDEPPEVCRGCALYQGTF